MGSTLSCGGKDLQEVQLLPLTTPQDFRKQQYNVYDTESWNRCELEEEFLETLVRMQLFEYRFLECLIDEEQQRCRILLECEVYELELSEDVLRTLYMCEYGIEHEEIHARINIHYGYFVEYCYLVQQKHCHDSEFSARNSICDNCEKGFANFQNLRNWELECLKYLEDIQLLVVLEYFTESVNRHSKIGQEAITFQEIQLRCESEAQNILLQTEVVHRMVYTEKEYMIAIEELRRVFRFWGSEIEKREDLCRQSAVEAQEINERIHVDKQEVIENGELVNRCHILTCNEHHRNEMSNWNQLILEYSTERHEIELCWMEHSNQLFVDFVGVVGSILEQLQLFEYEELLRQEYIPLLQHHQRSALKANQIQEREEIVRQRVVHSIDIEFAALYGYFTNGFEWAYESHFLHHSMALELSATAQSEGIRNMYNFEWEHMNSYASNVQGWYNGFQWIQSLSQLEREEMNVRSGLIIYDVEAMSGLWLVEAKHIFGVAVLSSFEHNSFLEQVQREALEKSMLKSWWQLCQYHGVCEELWSSRFCIEKNTCEIQLLLFIPYLQLCEAHRRYSIEHVEMKSFKCLDVEFTEYVLRHRQSSFEHISFLEQVQREALEKSMLQSWWQLYQFHGVCEELWSSRLLIENNTCEIQLLLFIPYLQLCEAHRRYSIEHVEMKSFECLDVEFTEYVLRHKQSLNQARSIEFLTTLETVHRFMIIGISQAWSSYEVQVDQLYEISKNHLTTLGDFESSTPSSPLTQFLTCDTTDSPVESLLQDDEELKQRLEKAQEELKLEKAALEQERTERKGRRNSIHAIVASI
eukprot:PhF_6_TR27836/c0_g1_i2/m.40617